MVEPRPLVCVFFKLPPSHQSVPRLHEIARNVLLPPLNRLSQALEAAQTMHPSSEAKEIWSETRQDAAEKMIDLERVGNMNYRIAYAFLKFLDSLRGGTNGSKAYDEFRYNAREGFDEAHKVQDIMLKFREDVRIAVGRITTMLSSDDKEMTSFVTECSERILELATGIEECNAILEEYREEVKELQQQSFDEKDNRPSEEEFQVVREKWQAFKDMSSPSAYNWEALWREMRGPENSGRPTTTSNNPPNPTTPADSSKSDKISFWRKIFRRLSCLSFENFVR
ncbi:hypothetical protein Agabi119p4_7882 [Agaricus bisporus var. burnettii]|uniref:Uncharacterized protein n=1 Tax=Agaricus bisporus var. burnettii TaxID=192524 RepID=A0A8H7C7R7_AGABI|nr:hypothetical protein Agabi119p4_7882 [Agaricus bisporus var. burnettii]